MKFLKVLLLLSVFSSLSFTAPIYVDCQDPEPDEWLDIFGITGPITILKVITQTKPAAILDLTPDSHIFRHHYTQDFSLQPSISAPVLTSPLRC
jgi:hypothetical protein